jgi:hypothetical protein
MGKGNMLKSEGLQRDLFSDLESVPTGARTTVPDPGRGPGKPEKDGDYIGNQHNESADTYVTKSNEDIDHKSNFEPGRDITKVNKERFVEKIVIFYTDKTFNEYLPDEQI